MRHLRPHFWLVLLLLMCAGCNSNAHMKAEYIRDKSHRCDSGIQRPPYKEWSYAHKAVETMPGFTIYRCDDVSLVIDDGDEKP
jgi:hypothetical protein